MILLLWQFDRSQLHVRKSSFFSNLAKHRIFPIIITTIIKMCDTTAASNRHTLVLTTASGPFKLSTWGLIWEWRRST